MEHRKVGAFRVTLVRSGVYYWDGGVLFGVVPKSLWSRHVEADELNRIPLGFNTYVIETGDRTIVLETGGGDKMDARAWERMRLPAPPPSLPETLAQSGFDPEAIDVVINSHLHWDHCGWNTERVDGRVRPCFPNAAYYARRSEWEYAHARHPRDAVSYLHDNYDPLVESGQMTLLEEDGEVFPGVRLDRVSGHNRDMMVLRAESQGETFCFLADLLPTAAHVTPTWVTAFDLYPLESIDNKVKWLNHAAEGHWLMGYSHDSQNAFGRVEQHGGRFVMRPA